ncbi:hypothetical protein [Streptococcus uberis]|uniref:hypothetical protein n=1 Tax=Streptococcus uberis TaxID=1349 RepID=UPI0027DB57F0|nr:hypothetical protein [Streptococcus uberis]MCK1235134.1 hypothetical protein [Streptococcus uberis]
MKRKISLFLFLASIFATTNSVFAGARQIGQLSHFRITPSYRWELVSRFKIN